jgi:hypothetical protein
MNPITAEQAAFLLQLELPALKNEHRTTRRVIEAIPLDKGDYRPDPQSKTAAELAWHVVAAEQRFLAGIAAGGFDFTPIHRPDSVKNSAQIAQWFGESFEKTFPNVATLSGEQSASRSAVPAFHFEPHDPSSRPISCLFAGHGRQGPRDLRRKLRFRGGEKGRASVEIFESFAHLM